MEANIKEVFASLPHVQNIWVMPDGHFYFHPKKGGNKINRYDEGKAPIVETKEIEVKKPTKKK